MTKATIGIALAKAAPSSGCEVKLRIEPVEGTGGHSHDGNRKEHAGKVEPDSVLFVPGESVLSAEYTSGEVAGMGKIIAEVLDGRGSVSSTQSVSIDVKVPDLRPLGSSEYYSLTGVRSSHSSNHYGQFWTNWMIDFVASDYYDQESAILGINDMSLEWGGLFDIGPPDGAFWSAPHKSHRTGTSADINRCAQSNKEPDIVDSFCEELGYPKGFVKVLKGEIQRLCEENNGTLVKEATYHCEF